MRNAVTLCLVDEVSSQFSWSSCFGLFSVQPLLCVVHVRWHFLVDFWWWDWSRVWVHVPFVLILIWLIRLHVVAGLLRWCICVRVEFRLSIVEAWFSAGRSKLYKYDVGHGS